MPTILLETALSPIHIYISRIPIFPSYTLSPPRSIFRIRVQTLQIFSSACPRCVRTSEKPKVADILCFTKTLYKVTSVTLKWVIDTVMRRHVLEQCSVGPTSFPQECVATEYSAILITIIVMLCALNAIRSSLPELFLKPWENTRLCEDRIICGI
jgi:hypothetical protein